MMKKAKKLLLFVLCVALVMSFSACADNADDVETQPSQLQHSEPSEAQPTSPSSQTQPTVSDVLITLYADRDSEGYNELEGEAEVIRTGIEPQTSAGYFRFVSPSDGVKVRLEEIRWSSLTCCFEPVGTVFEITTQKDKIYEFTTYVAETIPQYRLVAESGSLSAEYSMAADGKEVVTVLEMSGSEFVPDELTQDSAFYNLCVARAVSDVYYNDGLEKHNPLVLFDTFGYAVTLNYNAANGENQKQAIVVTDWESEAYFAAMYPELDGDIPEVPEESYAFDSLEDYGRYEVTPHLFDRFSTNEFCGVEDKGDGTYYVKIKVDDYRGDNAVENGLAVVVEADSDSPFGYVIEDVIDYDLSVG